MNHEFIFMPLCQAYLLQWHQSCEQGRDSLGQSPLLQSRWYLSPSLRHHFPLAKPPLKGERKKQGVWGCSQAPAGTAMSMAQAPLTWWGAARKTSASWWQYRGRQRDKMQWLLHWGFLVQEHLSPQRVLGTKQLPKAPFTGRARDIPWPE